jgi:orotidine-5'-phosphate decarboxylase
MTRPSAHDLARARSCVFAALDVATLEAARGLTDRLGNQLGGCKVGLELFTAAGPEAVRVVAGRGQRVFLDLKLHDIPETVRRAVAAASALGADLLTVHLGGGRAMLEAAVAAARQAGGGLRLLGVTVLTSLAEGDLDEAGLCGPLPELVRRRARLAWSCGLDGIVASPQEAAALRAEAPAGALIVTPGIRPSGTAAADQRRVATPAQAIAAGADLLVVGRPLRDAADPAAAARDLVAEVALALAALPAVPTPSALSALSGPAGAGSSGESRAPGEPAASR